MDDSTIQLKNSRKLLIEKFSADSHLTALLLDALNESWQDGYEQGKSEHFVLAGHDSFTEGEQFKMNFDKEVQEAARARSEFDIKFDKITEEIKKSEKKDKKKKKKDKLSQTPGTKEFDKRIKKALAKQKAEEEKMKELERKVFQNDKENPGKSMFI